MEASASRTAMLAAVVRGRHRLEEEPPWILDDPFALGLVGPVWETVAEVGDARHSAELGRQLRAGLALRSRFAEDRLEAGGFSQYVLLGAGLDSFVWRRPDLLADVTVFEVDHPASQAWKRARMDELGLDAPDRQVFAPVDFETGSLGSGLDAAGFDRERPALFSWLGVVPYLTLPAVEGTLRAVAACAPGSEVAVEYGLAPAYVDEVGRESVKGALEPSGLLTVSTVLVPRSALESMLTCAVREVGLVKSVDLTVKPGPLKETCAPFWKSVPATTISCWTMPVPPLSAVALV